MQSSKILAIASDHAGFDLKESLKLWLFEMGYEVVDFGTNSSISMDYPDVIHPLAIEIASGKLNRGIVICGSGIGVSMVANHHNGIRCALCYEEELVALARQHNNANVLALGARFTSFDKATKLVSTFLNTEFEGGRHQCRIDKIDY